MKDRIARSARWLVWSRGGLQVASFASTLVVARLLNPSDYGLMALAGAWVAFIGMMAEMGLGAAIVQFRDPSPAELNSCFWMMLLLTSVGYAGVYVAAPGVSRWLETPGLPPVLRALGLMLPLTAFRLVPESLLRKSLRLDRISQAEMIATLLTVPLTISLAWLGFGVWSLVTGALALTLIQLLAVFWFSPWRPGLRVGGPRTRQLFSYSIAILGTRACWALYHQLDTFVLGKVSGDVALGLYAMARQLATVPGERLSTIVTQLTYPLMAELQDDRQAIREAFARSVRLLAAITVPLSVGLLLVASDLVHTVLGAEWSGTAPLLTVFALHGMVYSIAALLGPVLMARFRTDVTFRYMLTQLLVMPVAFWFGAVWYGPIGVALAWLLIYPLALVWLVAMTLGELKMGWAAFLTQFRAAGLATALMAGAVLLVRVVWPQSIVDHSAWRLAASILAAGLAYPVGLLWFGAAIRAELLEVLGWMIRRSRRAT